MCHYCDYTISAPQQCPKCTFDGIRFSGLGTQRLELEVQASFPDAPMTRIIFRGEVQAQVEQFAEGVVAKARSLVAKHGSKVRILGPSLPPIPKLRGHHRYHAMMITQQPGALHAVLQEIQATTKLPEGVLYLIDIDPIDML